MKNIKKFEGFRKNSIYESMEEFPEAPEDQKTVQYNMYDFAASWLEKGNLTRDFKFEEFIERIKSQGIILQWTGNQQSLANEYSMCLEPDMTYTIWMRKKGANSGSGYEQGTWYTDHNSASKIFYSVTKRWNTSTKRLEDVKKPIPKK